MLKLSIYLHIHTHDLYGYSFSCSNSGQLVNKTKCDPKHLNKTPKVLKTNIITINI